MKTEKIHFWDNEKVETAIAAWNTTHDDSVFAQVLYPAFVGMASRLFYRFGFQERDAKDAVQECVIRMLAALPTFEPVKGKAMTFFTEIVRNFLLNLARKKEPTQNAIPLHFDDNEAEDAFYGDNGLFLNEPFREPQEIAAFIAYWELHANDHFKTLRQRKVITETLAALEAGDCKFGFDIARRANVSREYVRQIWQKLSLLTPKAIKQVQRRD